jgi:SAM-dependent methyltransferase
MVKMNTKEIVQQRTSEWEQLDKVAMSYHLSQWKEPKRSTCHFYQFIREKLYGSGLVLDVGCGAGAATAYLASQAPGRTFVGLDVSSELISVADGLTAKTQASNLSFRTGDMFDLQPQRDVDGVLSLQTLSWLPGFEAPLAQVFERLAPRWMALSSLFYPGEISCKVEVTEHTRGRSTFYNVYSIPELRRFCALAGYNVTASQPFQIDIDLPFPADPDLMSTHTVSVLPPAGSQEIRRIQISGPLLMNWYFVLIERAP